MFMASARAPSARVAGVVHVLYATSGNSAQVASIRALTAIANDPRHP